MVRQARTVKIGCVIAAGGWRRFGNGVFKVLESLEAGVSKPILVQVVKRAIAGGVPRENIVVVANLESQDPIQKVLKRHGLDDISMVFQYQRAGTVDAVSCAMSVLVERGISDFLVMFGDMPRWSEQTIRELIDEH